MIVFLDTEFSGLHQETTLMSIALLVFAPNNAKLNGRCFYAELTDYDPDQVNPWITENVLENFILGHLKPTNDEWDAYEAETKTSEYEEFGKFYSEFGCGTTDGVSKALTTWLGQFLPEVGPGGITIVADVLAFDWVLFNNLLANYDAGYPQLPEVVNYLPIDFSTMLAMYGIDPDVSRYHFCGPALLDDYETLLVPMPLAGAQHNALADTVQLRQGFIRLAAQMANSRALPHGEVFRFNCRNTLDLAAVEVKKLSQTNAIWILSMNELSLMNNLLDSVLQLTKMHSLVYHQPEGEAEVVRNESALENRPLDSHLVYLGIKFWLCVVPDLRDHDTVPRALVMNAENSAAVRPEYGVALTLVHEYLDGPVRVPSAFGQLYVSGHMKVVKLEEVSTADSETIN